MNHDPDTEQTPSERRKGNKATMDQPQEEFIADEGTSHSATPPPKPEENQPAGAE